MAMDRAAMFLALGMLISGSLNTLTTSYANKQYADGIGSPSTVWGKLNGEFDRYHKFDHPYFQAACMFSGELLCLMAYAVYQRQSARRVSAREAGQGLVLQEEEGVASAAGWRANCLFAIPAICDMVGTGTMYAGLCLSYASVFQMLRGSTVAFTAVISRVFLKRELYAFHWVSVVLVTLGVTIVGFASLASQPAQTDDKDQRSVLIGDALIVVAQLIVAVQMCAEEKIIGTYQTPALKVVGLEGIFGLLILGTLLVPMYFVHIQGYPFENAPDALAQMRENPTITLAMTGNVLSIAFFNFFGISITKKLSAAHRMVLDSVRTCVVWACSLALGWEKFHWLQVLGFLVLTLGTGMYNEIITLHCCFDYPDSDAGSDAGSALDKDCVLDTTYLDSNNVRTARLGASSAPPQPPHTVCREAVGAEGRSDRLLTQAAAAS